MLTPVLVVLLALAVNADPQATTTGAGSPFPTLGQSPVPVGPKPTGCSQLEILVARGTSEPGPFGVIVGDPLVANMQKMVPDSRGYAVQYPADATNQSVPTGAGDIVMRLTAQDTACPNQKFALVGYSQGARVIRVAAPAIPDAIQRNKILAVVMFGDPGLKAMTMPMAMPMPMAQLPPAMQSKLYENCAMGDPVCSQGTTFDPHLSYNDPGTMYQMDSAQFIRAAAMGMPEPAKTSALGDVPMASTSMNMPMPSTTMPKGMPSMSMGMPGMSTMPGEAMSEASSRSDLGGVWLFYAFALTATYALVIENYV